jgi:hypothetical protein
LEDCDFCGNKLRRDQSSVESNTLSDEDLEADAISRATGVVGTLCSSRWETRNTQYDWVKRTVEYTIECTDLVVGLTYRVYPKIRKRTAQDDGSGEWEDVELVPLAYVEFTATSDTHTLDDEGVPFELDHEQGWEYEITSATIERKAPSV